MKGALILSVALLVAHVSASPLTLEKSKDEKPLSVVDVPAGAFEAQDKTEQVEQQTPVVTATDEKPKDAEKVEGTKDEDDTTVFGFRLPSIVIIRRPAIFQDPFAGWESPFFGGFNKRPLLSPKPIAGESEEKETKEPLGEGSQIDEQKQNETVLVNNMIHRMHQQINNLFTSLFRPDAFSFPRPNFQRPFFSRPSFFAPIPESSEEDSVDFDKLPPNYKNSTSETKVIDGQVVTVNKTVHKISGNNSNGFFHFSVIKVRPSALPEAEGNVKPNPEITEESKVEVTVPEKKPETAEEMDPKMNEVDRPEGNEQKLTEVELKSTYETQNQDEGSPSGVEEVKIIPIMSEKLIQAQPGKSYSDLSSDIRINNLMENSPQARVRALFNPDEVEIFEV